MDDGLVRRVDAPSEIAEIPPIAGAPSIGAILQAAVEKGMAPESLEKLVGLYERVAATQAKQQFIAAKSAFRETCPPIPRRTENSQFKVTRNGVTTTRKYASLEDIEATIKPPLTQHGLDYHWSDAVVSDNKLTITCVITHVGGHSVPSASTVPVTSNAGCSEAQKYGAAMAYAKRFSISNALGLSTCDDDMDGEEPQNAEPITEDQAANLDMMIGDTKANRAGFLKFFGIAKVADLPASRFKEAIDLLERKRKQ